MVAETRHLEYNARMRYNIAKHNEARKAILPLGEVKALYEGGKTILEIATYYGVSVQPVKRILREAGVQKRQAAPRKGLLCGAKNPAWAGGRRARRDGYVLVWTPGGDVLEHRLVMECFLGRPLLGGEVVHHKDGDRSNNCLENLEILSGQSEHALMHGAQNRQTLLANGLKECTLCHLIKPTVEFYRTRCNMMGIQSWCKPCKNTRDSERRRKNRS